MTLFQKIKKRLASIIQQKKQTEPAAAYNLWSSTYDEQTNNPIVYLDELVFQELRVNIGIEGKTIIEVGCGTGKH